MRLQKIRTSWKVLLSILFLICIVSIGFDVDAEESKETIYGKLYEFEKSSKYEIFESEAVQNSLSDTPYGFFSIKGDVKAIDEINGITAYEVRDNNVVFTYKPNNSYINSTNEYWHLVEDKSNDVNGVKLENNILSGAVILQTSLTGDNWVTDVVFTNIREKDSAYKRDFYESREIQQVNGCFYRVIVVYELAKENQVDKGLLNWTGVETEYKKCAEVYQFYLINSFENDSDSMSASATPRKELGSKINTGKDNGFSGNEVITDKDPHYGWDIGTFFVNGYTREIIDDEGDALFLKNVGDRVTLWFRLDQDINCLDSNNKLSINEDKNGFDQYFEIEKTNFKHGTLIISYTDHEGKTHDPIIYTDYLAANTRTGANTKVELFEEGDYEVALNYEIKDSSGVASYSNYRVFFKFSIRNGNCMVYPFDTVTGNELQEGSITENGFKLDMAKSRYLTIDVVKYVIKKGDAGFVKDERFNRPAKDGETYVDEGIYVFTVKNLYTDSAPTEKTIYVGTNPVIRAMASGLSLEEINDQIAQGAELQNDGSLIFPVIEETEEVMEDIKESEVSKEVIVVDNQVTDEKETLLIDELENDDNGESNNIIQVVVVLSIVVVVVIAVLLSLKKKGTNVRVPEDIWGDK